MNSNSEQSQTRSLIDKYYWKGQAEWNNAFGMGFNKEFKNSSGWRSGPSASGETMFRYLGKNLIENKPPAEGVVCETMTLVKDPDNGQVLGVMDLNGEYYDFTGENPKPRRSPSQQPQWEGADKKAECVTSERILQQRQSPGKREEQKVEKAKGLISQNGFKGQETNKWRKTIGDKFMAGLPNGCEDSP
jgi:hypothetical protein